MNSATKTTGKFVLRVRRADGTIRSEHAFSNATTLAGRNHTLDVTWSAGAQITAWYIGLISNTSFDELADDDTMSSHAGWTESTAYDEATRQQWVDGGAASSTITNPSPAVFTMNANTTLKGAFITSSDTKDGTTGTLAVHGAFDGDTLAVDVTEEIEIFWADSLTNG